MEIASSAYRDRFVHERLPSADLLPEFRFCPPAVRYSGMLNAASVLIDGAIGCGWSERVAFRTSGEFWSYAEVAAFANRVAHVLVEDAGLIPGNRVLLRGFNSPKLAAIWLGVLKAGGVVLTTMSLLRANEIAVMLRKARVQLALCEIELLDDMHAATMSAPACCRTISFSNARGCGELESLMHTKPTAFQAVPTASNDPALIAFTSGSTGPPKATVHLHRDVIAIADLFPRSNLGTRADDVFLCSAPLAFTFGLGGHLVFPLRYGASSILLPTGSPESFLEAIEHLRPTIVMTAPTAYRAMVATAATCQLEHVRSWVSAGEHLPKSTFDSWETATGCRIVDGIGATEMLHIFVSSEPGKIRPGSTGRAVPGYTATVLDPELRPAKPGDVGRLAVRGPTGCRYLDDPRQATYVAAGWNLTGDAYVQDEDGYFWFQSRTDDLIVSSGYNISSAEVEEAVLQHPAVTECAVVSSPDPARGNLVKAFVRLADGVRPSPELAGEIQDFVKARIAPFKYPRAIEFVDRLPRNESGKVQRVALRHLEIERARLAAEAPGDS